MPSSVRISLNRSNCKAETQKLQKEYSRNETRLHQIYEDRLNDIIPQDFFLHKFNDIQNRQQDILVDLEKLGQKNHDYIQEGILILELMKDIRKIYENANFENKAKILNVLLSNCELKGASTSFYWNKPFDILFEMGETEKWGSSRCQT